MHSFMHSQVARWPNSKLSLRHISHFRNKPTNYLKFGLFTKKLFLILTILQQSPPDIWEALHIPSQPSKMFHPHSPKRHQGTLLLCVASCDTNACQTQHWRVRHSKFTGQRQRNLNISVFIMDDSGPFFWRTSNFINKCTIFIASFLQRHLKLHLLLQHMYVLL